MSGCELSGYSTVFSALRLTGLRCCSGCRENSVRLQAGAAASLVEPYQLSLAQRAHDEPETYAGAHTMHVEAR